MTGFEPMIAGLSTLVLNTVTETAKEESGSTLAQWLKKDIGKAWEQRVYNASGAYLSNYQERHGTLKVACVRMDAPMELDKLYTAVRLLERSPPIPLQPAMTIQTDAPANFLAGMLP